MTASPTGKLVKGEETSNLTGMLSNFHMRVTHHLCKVSGVSEIATNLSY